MADKEEITAGGQSFAEFMGSFAKISQLEEQIDAIIEKSKVPYSEVAKFIKASTEGETKNTPLFQFLKDIFETLEIGTLEVLYRDRFEIIFGVANSKVVEMFPDVEGQTVCHPVADLLSRFFSEDLSLPVDCRETACVNKGDQMCEFKVDIKPLAAYPYIMDVSDLKILELAKDQDINVRTLVKKFDMEDEEAIFRLEHLHDLGFLSDSNKPEPTVDTYLKYTTEHPISKEEFDPPWKDFSVVANAIAGATSFAQALKEVTPEEVMPWDEYAEDVIELKDKAEKSKSFAEFMTNISEEEED